MVSYSFKDQFAKLVETGEKRQTIRRSGKRHHARPGDTIQLYTGLRTKKCRKLGEAICESVEEIAIYLGGEWKSPLLLKIETGVLVQANP